MAQSGHCERFFYLRSMRPEVVKLLALGRVPADNDPHIETWLQEAEKYLDGLDNQATDEEARAIATLLNQNDGFGVSWTFLHFIESAPGWPLQDVLSMPTNEWIETLQIRVNNSALK